MTKQEAWAEVGRDLEEREDDWYVVCLLDLRERLKDLETEKGHLWGGWQLDLKRGFDRLDAIEKRVDRHLGYMSHEHHKAALDRLGDLEVWVKKSDDIRRVHSVDLDALSDRLAALEKQVTEAMHHDWHYHTKPLTEPDHELDKMKERVNAMEAAPIRDPLEEYAEDMGAVDEPPICETCAHYKDGSASGEWCQETGTRPDMTHQNCKWVPRETPKADRMAEARALLERSFVAIRLTGLMPDLEADVREFLKKEDE